MKILTCVLLLFLSACATSRPKEEVIDLTLSAEPAGTAYYYKPSDNAPPKGTFYGGEPIHVIAKQGKWYRTTYHGQRVVYILVDTPTPGATGLESSGSYQTGGSHTIQTGPRGGQYYINGNGNKTYIRRK